jgi:hypothetical protein
MTDFQYDIAFSFTKEARFNQSLLEAPKERAPSQVINLMDALRRSVEAERGGGERRTAERRTAHERTEESGSIIPTQGRLGSPGDFLYSRMWPRLVSALQGQGTRKSGGHDSPSGLMASPDVSVAGPTAKVGRPPARRYRRVGRAVSKKAPTSGASVALAENPTPSRVIPSRSLTM